MAKENSSKTMVLPEIDTRTIERKLKNGEITEAEYKKYHDDAKSGQTLRGVGIGLAIAGVVGIGLSIAF